MRWYFCWLGRGRVCILHVKQTWITWDQKVGLVASLQDSSEFLRQFAPSYPSLLIVIPLGGSLLHYITVGLCDQQLEAEVMVCHFWDEVVQRLWLPYESLPSPPLPPQSWVTPCWGSSFPDVHSPKKIPPGRNSWPRTLAASGWRRELGSELFNPTPALTNILVTSWENVSQRHLAKSLTLHY